MAIQNRVRELRAARGLTQEELADQIGVSQAHVSRIEAGAAPSLELAQTICRALEVQLSDAWPTSPSGVEVLHDASTAPDAAVA